jgi:hypothetical protein
MERSILDTYVCNSTDIAHKKIILEGWWSGSSGRGLPSKCEALSSKQKFTLESCTENAQVSPYVTMVDHGTFVLKLNERTDGETLSLQIFNNALHLPNIYNLPTIFTSITSLSIVS